MKANILDPLALVAISPAALRGYASFEGWQRTEAYGQYSEVYVRQSEGQSAEVILPVTNQIGDYASIVAQLIKVFAKEGNTDELAIYRDLTHADKDVVRITSSDADEDGSIPIESGVDLVTEARNALASAACSAREPQQLYHIGKIQQVQDYMQRVRLGQTEIGSFVVTLLAPVPPLLSVESQQAFWPEFNLEPYDRQVTRVLANGLSATANALAGLNRGMDIRAFEDAVKDGVSANLCEAVAAIAERNNGADLSVTWARTRPAPIPRSRVLFSRADAEPLREVARQFRLREPRNDVTLLGSTTKLQRSGKQVWGRVTFATFIDEKPRSVTVELPREDYERAVEAHKKRHPIVIVGDLVREGQRWHLRNPRNLAITIPES